jgi:hypothetical protein
MAMAEVTNLHHQLVRLISEMAKSWDEILIANKLYGGIVNMKHFLLCCEQESNSFYELLKSTLNFFVFAKKEQYRTQHGTKWGKGEDEASPGPLSY